MAKVGRYEVPEDWPVKGEAGRSFAEKLKNSFFSTYMAGEVTIGPPPLKVHFTPPS